MTDPILQTALEGPNPLLFGAIKIQFPGQTLRLLDGAGVIMISGETYVGEDPVFGTLDTIGTLNESIGEQAPEIEIGLLPVDGAAAATLASSAMQGSIVTVMLGAYDPVSGTILGQPEVLFLGEIDVPTLLYSEKGGQSVSYTCVSVFERLFEVSEGARVSDQFHQSIWPGELGFQHVTGAGKTLFWGGKRPVPSTIGYQNWGGGMFGGFDSGRNGDGFNQNVDFH